MTDHSHACNNPGRLLGPTKTIASFATTSAIGTATREPPRPRACRATDSTVSTMSRSGAFHHGTVACRTASVNASVRRWVTAWYAGSATIALKA